MLRYDFAIYLMVDKSLLYRFFSDCQLISSHFIASFRKPLGLVSGIGMARKTTE